MYLSEADGVPDAGEPVSDYDEHEDEEDEQRSSKLDIIVYLARHLAQPQQPDDLQRAEH